MEQITPTLYKYRNTMIACHQIEKNNDYHVSCNHPDIGNKKSLCKEQALQNMKDALDSL
jgi:hypothetical protein